MRSSSASTAGLRPELVERRGAQLRDQALKPADREVELVDGIARRSPPRARGVHRAGADSSIILSAPSSCSVSSCSSRAQRLRSSSDARIEWRSRSASTDCAVAIAIAALAANEVSRCSSSASKAGPSSAPVERDEHAASPVRGTRAERRRPSERRRRSARAHGPGGSRGRSTRSACPLASRIGASESPSGSVRAHHRGPTSPAAAATLHGVVLLEQHEQRARLDHRPAALHDQLEHPRRVCLEADRARDRRRGLEPADRALELLAAAPAPSYSRALSMAMAAHSASTTSRLLVLVVELGPARPCRSGRGCRRPRRGTATGTPRKVVIGG